MQDLAAPYLITLATQMGGISAFLGGFAATYLGVLFSLNSRSRAAGAAMGAALLSSVAFICVVVASTALLTALHPQAPRAISSAGAVRTAQLVLSLGFFLGLLCLLASLGLSGWLRSRRMGVFSTITALAGALLAGSLMVHVG